MEKIDSVGDKYYYQKSEKNKKQKISQPVKAQFPRMIKSVSESGIIDEKLPEDKRNQILEDLIDEIHKAGEKLKNAPLMENIKEYRQTVKNFLQFATRHMLGVEEKKSGFGIKKRKKYTLIKVIDQKLEDLTLEILNSQGQNLETLKRVDEINGLVVDLMR
ncbi:MAG: YaaR family protein [Spirochaetales bacterium]|nr:YaaR family protein [Spirochaetales bacterium]